MELVLVYSVEVAAIRGLKDRVRYRPYDKDGYSLCHSFLHAYHYKAESVLSVRFFLGVVFSEFWCDGD